MQYWLTFYCQLFGYASCSQASFLEALVMFAVLLVAIIWIPMIIGAAIVGIFGR